MQDLETFGEVKDLFGAQLDINHVQLGELNHLLQDLLRLQRAVHLLHDAEAHKECGGCQL